MTAKVNQSTPEGPPSTVDRRLFEKGQICRLPFVVPLNKSTAVRARAPPAPENRKSRLPKQESRKSWDDASRRPRFSRTSFRGPWVPHALGQAEGRPSTVERRRPTRRPPKVDQSTPNAGQRSTSRPPKVHRRPSTADCSKKDRFVGCPSSCP